MFCDQTQITRNFGHKMRLQNVNNFKLDKNINVLLILNDFSPSYWNIWGILWPSEAPVMFCTQKKGMVNEENCSPGPGDPWGIGAIKNLNNFAAPLPLSTFYLLSLETQHRQWGAIFSVRSKTSKIAWQNISLKNGITYVV